MAKKRSKTKSAKTASGSVSVASVPDKPASVGDSIETEAVSAAMSTVSPAALMKVCRLCQTKDGPFLNVFDTETMAAKKIEELMPVVIAEYDDLPHKICFRCSAKVEELHEFVQKCVKTQENIRKARALRSGGVGPTTKSSNLWEKKLIKTKLSNNDICNALINKALESLEDIPLKPLPVEEVKPIQSKQNTFSDIDSKQEDNDYDDTDLPLNQVSRDSRTTIQDKTNMTNPSKSAEKTSLDVSENKKKTRTSDSSKIYIPATIDEETPLNLRMSKRKSVTSKTPQSKSPVPTEVATTKSNVIRSEFDDSDNSIKVKLPEQINKDAVQTETTKNDKLFDIMDYICMIKVNGVGNLFQCKLCNRNFLNEEVVISHGCAKTGVPKIDFTKNLVTPEPPKITTVKYVNTSDIRKPPAVPIPILPKPASVQTPPPQPEVKPKPKIGPASKVKRPSVGMVVTPTEVPPLETKSAGITNMPSVKFPSAPNLKSRYKLVPGPNNTFTLKEDVANHETSFPRLVQKPNLSTETKPKLTQLRPSEVPQQILNMNLTRQMQSQVIDMDVSEEITPHVSTGHPYPVGLFQTVPQASGVVPEPVMSPPVPFTTPAMKKQSYTIVKTDNPSKLLISTKPQPTVEEPPKKKTRMSKIETRLGIKDTQPFNVTLEDSTRPKDNGFFTFINVDPLLQPSYVLPTDNIIQESQISTSTPQNSVANSERDLYACNMCTEKFSREKKLLAHIQSHYSKMDEEDQLRERNVKKRRKRI